MEETIFNKVANSALVTIDLADYRPQGQRTFIDLSQWLEEGILLREKPFRAALNAHDWKQYTDHFVAIAYQADTVIPAWAALLVASHLQPYAAVMVLGSMEALEQKLFSDRIAQLDVHPFVGKPLIIKGCSDASLPQDAYIQLVGRLQSVAKSLFYGEACSSVPLWKAKKQG